MLLYHRKTTHVIITLYILVISGILWINYFKLIL